MGNWVDIKDYDPIKHGTSLIVKMNRNDPEHIISVVYVAEGNSSKWWTSYPDGGLRTCGTPDLIYYRNE